MPESTPSDVAYELTIRTDGSWDSWTAGGHEPSDVAAMLRAVTEQLEQGTAAHMHDPFAGL